MVATSCDILRSVVTDRMFLLLPKVGKLRILKQGMIA